MDYSDLLISSVSGLQSFFLFLLFSFFFLFFFCHPLVATSDAMTGGVHRDIMTLTMREESLEIPVW